MRARIEWGTFGWLRTSGQWRHLRQSTTRPSTTTCRDPKWWLRYCHLCYGVVGRIQSYAPKDDNIHNWTSLYLLIIVPHLCWSPWSWCILRQNSKSKERSLEWDILVFICFFLFMASSETLIVVSCLQLHPVGLLSKQSLDVGGQQRCYTFLVF